jgi:hypothetical protein
MDITIVLVLLIALAVAYKLGLFNPIIDLVDVGTRESRIYNREHKVKVARRYLGGDNTFSVSDVKKINTNIESIDNLKFD